MDDTSAATRARSDSGASTLAKPLADAVFFYIGEELDWEVELAIPSGAVAPVTLGKSGRLGWTTWVSPKRFMSMSSQSSTT